MSLRNPTAEIIAIGSEFLHGHRVESNSLFLAEGLAKCGIEVNWKTLVGDSETRIASALSVAARRTKFVIISGGLGSTVDDCTREAVAAVTGLPLRSRTKALQALKVRYASHGRRWTKALSRQALLPTGAEMLENPVGSAPGFFLEWKGCVVVTLPGVSKEARAMFESQVVPRLVKRVSPGAGLRQKMLYSIGLTELQIDERVQPIIQRFPSVELSLLASTQGVAVVLREWGHSNSSTSRSPDQGNMTFLTSQIRDVLEDNVYAEDGQTMEGVVGKQLTSQHLRLTLAESCTGGLIGHRLTQVPGSSSYLDRGFVCYSNQAKHDLLGVSRIILSRNGAVSAPVAQAMAVGARTRSNTDIGLSVTGIAGPGGGSDTKPVGLVYIGIDGPRGSQTKKFTFHGDREDVKMRAAQAALNVLRLYLLNHTKP